MSLGQRPARRRQRPRGRGGHAPDQAVQRQGAGAGGQRGGLAEVQAQRLLGLQAADQAVADGQPVQAGDEQLAGQQATLVHQRLVRLARGALVTACGGGPRGCTGPGTDRHRVALPVAGVWELGDSTCRRAVRRPGTSTRCRSDSTHAGRWGRPGPDLSRCGGLRAEGRGLTGDPELGEQTEEQGHAVLGVRGGRVHRQAAGLQEPPDADDHHELAQQAQRGAVPQEAVARPQRGALQGEALGWTPRRAGRRARADPGQRATGPPAFAEHTRPPRGAGRRQSGHPGQPMWGRGKRDFKLLSDGRRI